MAVNDVSCQHAVIEFLKENSSAANINVFVEIPESVPAVYSVR
jgi:hypothetical protein